MVWPRKEGVGYQDRPLGQWKARTVQTGSVMISAVIEHTYWSGTTASLASDLEPAAPLPPPSPPSAVARSSVSASASAAAAASVAATSATAAATAIPRALDAAATRIASRAATSCTCFAASGLAASAAASCFALRSASCCAPSSLWHWARASTPTPPSRTSRGSAASAASSADSPPPAMAARSAASALSAADTTGSGAATSGEAGAASGAPLDSSPAAAARPAFFFFLDFFEGESPLACSAGSIATSTRATCGGAACCRVVSAVVVRPCALACREGRCGRSCRAARCRPPALRVRLKATVAIAPSTTESTTKGQASGTTAQHRARPRPSERHDACCRMSFAVAGSEAVFVEQLGVGLGSQQGLHARLLPSGSSLNQGGLAIAGLQVGVGCVLQEEEQGGEVAQVDARASVQQLPHHLHEVAVGCDDVEQADGCGLTAFNWNRVDRTDRASLAHPAGHLLQLASPGRLEDLDG
eukprot:scaffold47815_cov67-Phaeocystis_antarctica.AAC.1